MTFEEQIAAIQATGHVHGDWYLETYPDAAILNAETGMRPAAHYLRYGAAMGRDPGKAFRGEAYREAYPDVAATGMNPLLHFALYGRQEGRSAAPDLRVVGMRRVDRARAKLLGLGLTEVGLADLRALSQDSPFPLVAAAALRELALWEMRSNPDAPHEALRLLEAADARIGVAPDHDADDRDLRRTLAVARMLCLHALGEDAAGRGAFVRAEAEGLCKGVPAGDIFLARANFDAEAADRLSWMNRLQAAHAIPALRLLDGDAPAYDRLTVGTPPQPVTDGPLVSVLVASYAAADTIPTTLRSLSEQSWRNLEILVLDDCSPDDTAAVVEAHAARDPRIRLVRMERNGGAYVARNRGLDLARGTFVTLNDADDWSHPLKIETQVRHMMQVPGTVACTSQQARATSDLRFLRWTGRGRFVIQNTSSLMFRRGPVRGKLGYWDTVRFAADSELIRRMRRAFGGRSVVDLQTGPLSYQRDSETSVVADPVKGMNGFYYGVRKAYFDAQRHHHRTAKTLRYDGDPVARPFPVPPMMRPDRSAEIPYFDLVLAGDFRAPGKPLWEVIHRVRDEKAAGRGVGLVELYEGDDALADRNRMDERLRAEVDGDACRVLVFGETATCDAYEHLSGDPSGRYQPTIEVVGADADEAPVNAPPASS